MVKPIQTLNAPAWVVVQDGKILTRTLMDTERGAMVNWLITERNFMILNSASDEEIQRLFWLEKDKGANIWVHLCLVTVKLEE